jgi:hypothetical protein
MQHAAVYARRHVRPIRINKHSACAVVLSPPPALDPIPSYHICDLPKAASLQVRRTEVWKKNQPTLAASNDARSQSVKPGSNNQDDEPTAVKHCVVTGPKGTLRLCQHETPPRV